MQRASKKKHSLIILKYIPWEIAALYTIALTPSFSNDFQSLFKDIHHRTPMQTQNVTSNSTIIPTISDGDRNLGYLILLVVLLSFLLLAALAGLLITCCSACAKRYRRSRDRDSSHLRQETGQIYTETHNRQYNCRKSQSPLLSSRPVCQK